MLRVGNKAPEFEAVDSEGTPFSLVDILGSTTVLYFYPKDETPGCTKEACDFRDKIDDLETRGVLVIGVSPDGLESHQKFIETHDLNFPLLCDQNLEMCKQFGVVVEKDIGGKKNASVERTTFVIDERGIIRWIEKPVQVKDHIKRVLHAIDEL